VQNAPLKADPSVVSREGKTIKQKQTAFTCYHGTVVTPASFKISVSHYRYIFLATDTATIRKILTIFL